MGVEVCVIEPGAMDTAFFHTLSKNSDAKMKNAKSPYHKLYKHDLAFRSKQSKSSVDKCADVLVKILDQKRLKVRYTTSFVCNT